MTPGSSIFHLAIPCRDLDEARGFYVDRLGVRLARSYDDRITLDFWGDQVVCHLAPDEITREPHLYPRHFGRTFKARADFDRFLARVEENKLGFFLAPFTRFEGRPDEHQSFCLLDPSNNILEFKVYTNVDMIY